jgi:riboflavin biosynthesis pyrimidine reductase
MKTRTPEHLKRPYALMLVAVSLDGKIAPRRRAGQANPVGPSLIDPEIMGLHNQQRARADAIMVGLNCILLDDSRLTLRKGPGRNPARIVLDGLAETPLSAKVLGSEAPTIIASLMPAEQVAALKAKPGSSPPAVAVVDFRGSCMRSPRIRDTAARREGHGAVR